MVPGCASPILLAEVRGVVASWDLRRNWIIRSSHDDDDEGFTGRIAYGGWRRIMKDFYEVRTWRDKVFMLRVGYGGWSRMVNEIDEVFTWHVV